MQKAPSKSRIPAILISSVFIVLYSGVSFPSIAQEGMQKKGLVLIVNREENFIFIDLGRSDVKKGDFVEVYRASERIATASVKRAMKKMSEASIIQRTARVAVGDRVTVTESRERLPEKKLLADSAIKLKTKIRQLEEEKEETVEARLKALEEAQKLASKTFKAQLTFLEESQKDTVKALDKKLKKLQEKKEKTETKLDTKIALLKHAEEHIKKGLVSPGKIRKDTITKLEEKLDGLEKSKKDTLEDLKQEIEALEKSKVKIKFPPRPKKKKEVKETAERKSDELEKKLKKKVVRYKLPEKETGLSRKGERFSLEGCISVAMERHLPLRIAKKQLRLAEMRLAEANRKLGPTVTAKWELTDGRVSGAYYDGEKIAVEAKQPLFYGGELVFSIRQAKVNLEIVKNDYNRIKNDLILQVKKGYYNLDKAENALKIQEKLQSETQKLHNTTKAGYDAGVIAKVEFLKVSSQYNQANFQVASAEEDISIANLILQQAMNIDREIRIIPLGEPGIIELGLRDCFDLAFLNRPEMKISHLALEHYEYEKKIMQARTRWPRADLLGMYANTREDFIDYDRGDDKPRGLGPEYYVGTKISMPLWGSTVGYSFTKEKWQPIVRTTKATKSNTHEFSISFLDKLEDLSGLTEAELEYMRSQDDLNKKKQEITLEVKEVFFKYKKALFLMDVAESKLEFQTKQVEITDIRRELGEVQYSDVIEEMIKLAEEEFAHLQAISDYYVAIASLNKAVGLEGHFEI